VTTDASKPMSGVRKAAVLLLMLGSKRAAEMISLCDLQSPEVERLAMEMASLREVDEQTRQAVAREFSQQVSRASAVGGGPRFAEEVLVHLLGQEAAADVIRRAARPRSRRPFASLVSLAARQLSDVLREEHPQVTAVVLRYLPRKQAGEVLSALPDDLRIEVVMRLVKGGEPCPETLQRMELALADKATAVAGWEAGEQAHSTAGPRALVEILNQADIAVENAVLESLAQRDPELGEQVRESMFIFDDLPRLDPRALQMVLREVDALDLAMALKGAAEPIRKVIFENLSENAAAGLREDLQSLGPVRRRDVYAAQQKIVMAVRARVSEGKISIRQEREEEEMVA
jgi:flagellar motor switch protein FliG